MQVYSNMNCGYSLYIDLLLSGEQNKWKALQMQMNMQNGGKKRAPRKGRLENMWGYETSGTKWTRLHITSSQVLSHIDHIINPSNMQKNYLVNCFENRWADEGSETVMERPLGSRNMKSQQKACIKWFICRKPSRRRFQKPIASYVRTKAPSDEPLDR